LRQVLLVGFDADAEQDVADGELGLAEGRAAAGDEGACQLEEVVGGGLGEGFGELLGFVFLDGVEGLRHGSSSDKGGGFFIGTSLLRLVYKNSTKFRDAHTIWTPGKELV
jgi:hypothetical protein